MIVWKQYELYFLSSTSSETILEIDWLVYDYRSSMTPVNGGKSFEFSFNVCMLENYECGSKKQKERLQKRACRRIKSIHPSLLSDDHLPAVFDWFLRFYICIIIKSVCHLSSDILQTDSAVAAQIKRRRRRHIRRHKGNRSSETNGVIRGRHWSSGKW